jgi:hypothetical protein
MICLLLTSIRGERGGDHTSLASHDSLFHIAPKESLLPRDAGFQTFIDFAFYFGAFYTLFILNFRVKSVAANSGTYLHRSEI